MPLRNKHLNRGCSPKILYYLTVLLSIPCLINYLAFNDQGFEDNGNESRIININWDCKFRSYDYNYGRRQANCPGSIFQNSTDFCLDWKSDAWKDEVCNSKEY